MDVIGQYLPTKDQVQIRFMPNKTLVNKMLGSLNPNGRDLVIDGCDSIRRRVRSEVPGVAKKNLKELTDAGALDVMIDVLKLWMEDAPVSGRCAKALMWIVRKSPTDSEADQLLELGGLKLAERLKGLHQDDLDLQKSAKELMKMLQTRAGALACKEIRICKFCAVNNMDMDSAKRLGQLVNPFQRDAGLGYSRKDAMVHKKKGAADISALVKRVLNHMREHLKDEGVQEFGLEAIMEFASDHDDGGALLQDRAAKCVVLAIEAHPEAYNVSWKGCVAVQTMCRKLSLSSELGKAQALGALKQVYEDYKDDREVRQQAVWAIGSMLNVPANIERTKRANMYTLVQDVVTRLEDRTVAAEQKIALPLPLRAIWTNEQLHSIKLKKMDEKRQSGETEAKATQQRRAPLPRRGAKKLARVDDQFAAGEPGLVDSQEYPFLKKPGLEYYTTKEKRNEMSLYNPD